MRIILSLLIGLALTAPVGAQSATSGYGTAPDAGARQAARAQCREEARGRGLRGPDVRDAVRLCMQARFPGLGPRAAGEGRQVRMQCRDDARQRGLRPRTPEFRSAVQACFSQRRPDLARAQACRQEARARGLAPRTPEFRQAVRACRGT